VSDLVWARLVPALPSASSVALATVVMSVFVVSAWLVGCGGVVVTVADSVSALRRGAVVRSW
jgi:hypothetical protein